MTTPKEEEKIQAIADKTNAMTVIIDMCAFYHKGIFCGRNQIPQNSTREQRRQIAKALCIQQYDKVIITTHELGEKKSEFVADFNEPNHSREMKESMILEAEPII